jgi:nucleoside-diphosphate-sugar epimerase
MLVGLAGQEMQMAVMITGGTGFLGSYLTRHLVREKGIAGKDLIAIHHYPLEI